MNVNETLQWLTGGTHARIDLDAYVRNIERLRKIISPGTALMAVVKADAYGHGAVACAGAAIDAGVAMLGVARLAEGVALRRAGIRADILVLGPTSVVDAPVAVEHNIAVAIGTESMASRLGDALSSSNGRLRVHLKVDTGMRRYGVLPEEALHVTESIDRDPALILEGVFTHFSCADEHDGTQTQLQIARFERVIEDLRANETLPPWIHLANSAGVLSGRSGDGNLVRCGIATYGLSPSVDVPAPDSFEPVMSIHSRVGRRFTLSAGEGVSYGLTYRGQENEQVATVPVGYADGLSRDLSNAGWFSARDRRLPIRGRICMDQTIVGEADGLAEGDELTVFGPGPEDMTLDQAASLTGTINYELATRITARVPRIYYRGGRPAAWDHTLLGERGHVV